MLTLLRTDAEHPDYPPLVARLDASLAVTDKEDHAFYDQFNGSEAIKHVVLAFRANEPVGCGAIKHHHEGVVEVKRVFVGEEARGAGVAVALMAALEAWAAELGYRELILETGVRQVAAVRLYEKLGYARMPNYPPYDVMEGLSVCFRKAVPPAL